jgi:hypothetical protein
MTQDTSNPKCTESFATYDPATSSWRTSQGTFPWGSDKYSQTWPRAGMTRNGIAYRLPPSAPRTYAIASSSSPNAPARWPTATTSDAFTDRLQSTQQEDGSMHSVTLAQAVQRWPTPRAADYKGGSIENAKDKAQASRPNGAQNLENEVAKRHPSVPGGGQLNPTWVEWLMGFPIGWTSLEDSETP